MMRQKKPVISVKTLRLIIYQDLPQNFDLLRIEVNFILIFSGRHTR